MHFLKLSWVECLKFVYLKSTVVAKAASKNSSKDQKGKWLKTLPLRALPMTPKLMMKLVPLPF